MNSAVDEDPSARMDPIEFSELTGLAVFPTIASGAMGTAMDQRMAIPSQATRERLEAWMGGRSSLAVDRFRANGHGVEIETLNGGLFEMDGTPEASQLGGNAQNTFRAMLRVAEAHGLQEALHFIAHYSDGLDHLLRVQLGINGVPKGDPRIELRDRRLRSPVRASLVMAGPNGADPLYVKVQPHGLEAPPLPDAPEVFLSSYSCDQTARDVWVRIREYRTRRPAGKIYLSPGMVQIQNGIPRDILSEIYCLACNRTEALKLLEHLDVVIEPFSPEKLVRVFVDCGVQEVRITDGAKGVYAMGDTLGGFFQTPQIPRDHPAILQLVRRYLLSERFTKQMLENPDFNGCGDARLGVELAARAIGIFEDPQKAILFSCVLAAVQTYNLLSNIGNFPDALIYAAIGVTEQLAADTLRNENSALWPDEDRTPPPP